ncbi:hypothetical protein NW759_017450, partial [Fusarium solani]
SLEEEVGRLSRGKKRKAIPNPNKRFMTLAEALVTGETISEANEAIKEADAVEDVIEVGGMEEVESSNSEEEELAVVGTAWYLGSLVGSNPTNLAPVIFLQECTPSDLATIAAAPWVRERFHLTDLDATNWATNHYGTVTLIDSRLPITAAFRVHYSKTRMDRDAFFVDVSIEGKTVRLCNTHLESMVFNPPYRPPQMQLVAQYLREEKVHAALAAGDFNAIQPFDRTLHTDNGLKDAFLELGGKEDTEEGYTWGQQAATKLRKQFGCSRMDKVYFCGGAEVVKFERFGEDVLTEGEEESSQIVALGFEKAWVTDHLGIKTEVQILGDKSSSRL